MAAPVALIIGAGPNIGASTAKAFAAKGYKLALAARSYEDETSSEGFLHIKADLSDPDNVKTIFSKVKDTFGAPSVVAYNAALFTYDGDDPILGFSPKTFAQSIAINTTSAIVALAQSIEAFRSLPASASKTFLYTGNLLNVDLIPGLMTLGIVKTATAYAIRTAASTDLYTKQGMKFYYMVERSENRGPMGHTPTADEAAKVSVELAEKKDQGDWHYVFIKGKGQVPAVL